MKLRYFFLTILSLCLILSLSGCNFALLNPKGIVAAEEKQLLIDAVLLMLIVVVPVIILSFFFAWKFRAGNKKAKYLPNWGHNNALEAVVWAIPCMIILVLGIVTWVTSHRLDPYRPLDVKGKTLNIQVVALEWKWLFIYPDQNIATVNYLELPVNVPVKFSITSDAPMNSFSIPQLAGQIYAMAGMNTQLHLIANEKGVYRGQSTNFSGDGFSDMNFQVKVTSPKDFNQWVQTVRQGSKTLTLPLYNNTLTKPSEEHAIEYYSSVEKGIYDSIIMKYMMPPLKQNNPNSEEMGMPAMPQGAENQTSR